MTHGRIDVYLQGRAQPVYLMDLPEEQLQELRRVAAAQAGTFTWMVNGTRTDIYGAHIQYIENLLDDDGDTEALSLTVHRTNRR